MNTFGRNIRLSIFGESHGQGIGIVIDGLPGGIKLDVDRIEAEMKRRAPGRSNISTSRKEADKVEILSGFVNGMTTGTPIAGVIRNTNTISKHYDKDLMRPGHADYTAYMKYGENRDYRGGGHFSARITTPLVFAGVVAKQVLEKEGVFVGAHILKIADVADSAFDPVNVAADELASISKKDFPVIDDEKGKLMKERILGAKSDKNSVGGIAECAIVGMPPGKGEPFFGSVESRLSAMLYSVPAVKAVMFGAGADFASMRGSEANDEFYVENGAVKTYTNNNGGINGGITNGMPVLFRAVLKPTPSIAKKQRTVDIEKMENTEIEIHGRHDPCIVHRGTVVIENAAAAAALDLLYDKF